MNNFFTQLIRQIVQSDAKLCADEGVWSFQTLLKIEVKEIRIGHWIQAF